jgi:aldose 1-epimerase
VLNLKDIPAGNRYYLYSLPKGHTAAKVTNSKTNHTINCTFSPELAFLAIYRSKDENAISLEPYTCITDPFNSTLDPQLTGANSLAAHEEFRFSFATCVYL